MIVLIDWISIVQYNNHMQNSKNLNTKKSKKYLYGFLMVLVCVVWGAGNPATKIGLETIPSFLMLVMRFGGAFLIFLVIFRTKIIKAFNRKNILPCCFISVVTALTYISSQIALYLTSATMAGFLMGLAVVFTPFLNFFLYRNMINKKFIPVIILVIIGMYFLCGGGMQFAFGIGEFFALLASLFYGLWLVLTPKYVHDVGPVALSSLQCGVAAVICLPFFFIFEFPFDISGISSEGWTALVYVTVVCTVIVYLVQNQSLKFLSPVFVSLVLCLEPVFSALFSFILLDEKLTLIAYAGGLLIIAGLMIASFLEGEE